MDAVNLAVATDVALEDPYGKEAGHKTILHLALEEDDGEPYVEELLRAGALANHYNNRTGNAPVHVAAAEALPDIFRYAIAPDIGFPFYGLFISNTTCRAAYYCKKWKL